MIGIIDIGGVMLGRATAQAEAAAQNITNATTPGYRSRRIFPDLINTSEPSGLPARVHGWTDMLPGKFAVTSNPLDLAIEGEGFFVIGSGEDVVLTRAGSFVRSADGWLTHSSGGALQGAGGAIRVQSQKVSVLPDGTVLDDGEPVDRIRIAKASGMDVRAGGGTSFAVEPATMTDATGYTIVAAVLESSNVSTASEMIGLMSAMRSAESGQRLVQTYDDLMGRIITTFSQQTSA